MITPRERLRNQMESIQRFRRPTRRKALCARVYALVIVAIATATLASSVAAEHLGRMPAPREQDSIVIFAPHPDDESLGSGGYIQQAVAAHAKLRVVLITNGEYSESPLVHMNEPPGERPQGFQAFGTVRQEETIMALGLLGVPRESITFLGYPDHLVGDMWQPRHWLPVSAVHSSRLNTTKSPYPNSLTPHALYCGESLLNDIEKVLVQDKPTIVITINPSDLHNDHWPTYAFTRFALDELASEGSEFARECHMYTYLIHRKTWPAPKANLPKMKLVPPAPLADLYDWLSVPLTTNETRRKGEAISLYLTQGGDKHPFMRSFVRTNDLYAAATVREWSGSLSTPSTEIIRDPAGSCDNGGADIVDVRLSRTEQRMIVKIDTREPIPSNVGFHFSIHAGGKSRQDRIAAQFDYQKKSASGLVMIDRTGLKIPPSSIRYAIEDNTAILDVPYPLYHREPSFFLFHAWTTIRGHEADKTTTATMHIQPKRQS